MSDFCCPVCKNKLVLETNSYRCGKNHTFDIAKSGYVNLLPSNKMHSKTPGDNKLMVTTRNQFLNKGYYAPLLRALCEQVQSHVAQCNSNAPVIVDAGCGEGYYTTGICSALEQIGISPTVLGVDISKEALKLAGNKAKQLCKSKIEFAVASVFELPISNEACDILIEIFAPFSGQEYHRVLKDNGIMILVIPAPQHLYELKRAIYDQPYENETKPYHLDGFELVQKRYVKDEILLESNEDIMNLFSMTPYYYKTSKQDTQRLGLLQKLSTTIEFEILSYQKTAL